MKRYWLLFCAVAVVVCVVLLGAWQVHSHWGWLCALVNEVMLILSLIAFACFVAVMGWLVFKNWRVVFCLTALSASYFLKDGVEPFQAYYSVALITTLAVFWLGWRSKAKKIAKLEMSNDNLGVQLLKAERSLADSRRYLDQSSDEIDKMELEAKNFKLTRQYWGYRLAMAIAQVKGSKASQESRNLRVDVLEPLHVEVLRHLAEGKLNLLMRTQLHQASEELGIKI